MYLRSELFVKIFIVLKQQFNFSLFSVRPVGLSAAVVYVQLLSML